ncbi:Uncharacterized protein dnm_015680 [Desulfonema magnum]|uniref:Uncharacterized protein n=1 Tax=Desulfonema magnum TaxID=45655 RepID=A0A975GLA4_9BACT|nr:Uncharacterized protein dnm_015680 [Desulfonema magnum]
MSGKKQIGDDVSNISRWKNFLVISFPRFAWNEIVCEFSIC